MATKPLSRKIATAVVIAAWNDRLAEDGLPEELDPIPRRHTRSDAHYRFEQDSDTVALDDPPSAPKYKRPGKPVGYDLEDAKERAIDLLHNGNLKGRALDVWTWFCAGHSQMRIAHRLGMTEWQLRFQYLAPLKRRAGIPVEPAFDTRGYSQGRKRKRRPFGLKYKINT